MTFVQCLEWAGCAFSVFGSFLLATNTRVSAAGWLIAIVGNVAWIVFATINHTPGVFIQSACFAAINLLGAWRWIMCASTAPTVTAVEVPRMTVANYPCPVDTNDDEGERWAA